MEITKQIKQPWNTTYVVFEDRNGKYTIEEMTEAEYLNQIAWLTSYKKADYMLSPEFRTLDQKDDWDEHYGYDSFKEEEKLESMTDEELEAAGVLSIKFSLGGYRFGT